MPKLTGDRNQCAGCGEFFNSTTAFDKHRTGPFGRASGPSQRRCMTPDEMRAIGMTRPHHGFWISEPMSAEEKRRREEAKKARLASTPHARSRPRVPGVPTYTSTPPAAPTRERKALKK